MIKKLLSKIMIECDEATMLITKNQHTQLSLWDRLQLKYHKMICPPCQDWEDQNKVITTLTKKEKTYILSEKKKEEIKECLNEKD